MLFVMKLDFKMLVRGASDRGRDLFLPSEDERQSSAAAREQTNYKVVL
jgi:hypothetical protein